MSILQKLKEANVDLSVLGLELTEESEPYSCTPEGAKIFGRAGVDGIHYCTIPEFGEMVFIVSPMNFDHCVHPVAENVKTLFALLLTCGDMAVLEQCSSWDEKQYRAFLKDNPITKEQMDVLDTVRKTCRIFPIRDVFRYVKELQKNFDYESIPYASDSAGRDLAAEEWSVGFACGFGNHKPKPIRTVTVNRWFLWGDEEWYVPAAYVCNEGLVLDYCIKIDRGQMEGFLEKWNLQDDWEDMDEIRRERLLNEQPMNFVFHSTLIGVKEKSACTSGCGVNWVPSSLAVKGYVRDGEAKRIVDHYGLDPQEAWALWRCSYPMQEMVEMLDFLEVELIREPKERIADAIGCPKDGDVLTIVHPVSEECFAMHVKEVKEEVMEHRSFSDLLFPPYCRSITYSTEPETDAFYLRDLVQNDPPRPVKESGEFVSIGQVSAFAALGSNGMKRKFSSLHFEKDFTVNWVPVFRVKEKEDQIVKLIG